MLKIEITGDTPLEALASLTAFGMHCMGNQDVYSAANRILEAERAKEKKAAAEAVSNSDTQANRSALTNLKTPATTPNTKAPADLPEEPYVEDPPHGNPEGTREPGGGEEVEQGDTPTYTIEQIRARGTEAARIHGTPAVKAILTELGAKGMGTLEKSKYPAFMAKLDALGTGKEQAGDTNA